MSDILLRVIGCSLVAFVLIDSFLTVLTIKGSGPLTRYLSRWIWRPYLSIHRRKPIHNILSFVGPSLLIKIIIIWYFLAALGWFCIFASEYTAVVSSTTGSAVSTLQKFYFTGVTIGNLGYGDLVPNGFPWTFLASLSTFMCTFIVSTAVSYIIPVISAAVGQQKLAKSVNSLGASADEIYQSIFESPDSDAVKSYLLSIAGDYENLARQYLSYPILTYFHTKDERSVISLQTIKLSKALLRKFNDSETRGLEKIALMAISSYIENAYGQFQEQSQLVQKKGDSRLSKVLLEDLNQLATYDGWNYTKASDE